MYKLYSSTVTLVTSAIVFFSHVLFHSHCRHDLLPRVSCLDAKTKLREIDKKIDDANILTSVIFTYSLH